jgi:chromodomain-helicase-DNA-binding protein 7
MMHQSSGKIRKVLLVVPVNTVANWEEEFEKWTKDMKQKCKVYNSSDGSKRNRERLVIKWSSNGGVFLVSDGLYRNLMNPQSMKSADVRKELENPDVIVLDESHTMLKNKDNVLFKLLANVNTQRRICLTGTPFQVSRLCFT